MQQLSDVQMTQAGNQKGRRQTPSAPTVKHRKDGADILREIRERRARRQEAAATSAKTEEAAAEHDQTVEMVAGYLDADNELTVELNELNRTKGRHPRGSVQDQETLALIEQRTDEQATVRKELTAIRTSNSLAYDEGRRRYNFRQEALESADSNRTLVGSATVGDIRARVSSALEAGQIVVTMEKATFSFDRQGYNSVWPDDPSVTEVTMSLKELIEDLQNRHESQDQAIIAELYRGGFYVSTRRDPDTTRKGESLDSELDLLRKESGVVRKVSEFLAGNGQRYIARVGRGFIVLEHRDGKFFAVKTSDTRTGRALFTVPDRESGARMARRSAPEINNSGMPITPSNLEGIWYDPLRQSLEEDLRRETESDQRRETADGLRNVSNLENPLTFSGLMEGGVGVMPVSISYQDPETDRRHTVTFQVAGNGTTFSVTNTVPGAETMIKRVKRDRSTRQVISSKPFLTDFIGKETPLAVLGTDSMWRLVGELNREFERNWQLAQEAKQRNAAYVSNENLDGLTAIKGVDGIYAVPATIRNNRGTKESPNYVHKPVGYIIERKSSKVEIVWAVPGTSVAFANWLRGELEISNLSWRMRLVLGNCCWVIRKLVPEHLQLSSKQQETETE